MSLGERVACGSFTDLYRHPATGAFTEAPKRESYPKGATIARLEDLLRPESGLRGSTSINHNYDQNDLFNTGNFSAECIHNRANNSYLTTTNINRARDGNTKKTSVTVTGTRRTVICVVQQSESLEAILLAGAANGSTQSQRIKTAGCVRVVDDSSSSAGFRPALSEVSPFAVELVHSGAGFEMMNNFALQQQANNLNSSSENYTTTTKLGKANPSLFRVGRVLVLRNVKIERIKTVSSTSYLLSSADVLELDSDDEKELLRERKMASDKIADVSRRTGNLVRQALLERKRQIKKNCTSTIVPSDEKAKIVPATDSEEESESEEDTASETSSDCAEDRLPVVRTRNRPPKKDMAARSLEAAEAELARKSLSMTSAETKNKTSQIAAASNSETTFVDATSTKASFNSSGRIRFGLQDQFSNPRPFVLTIKSSNRAKRISSNLSNKKLGSNEVVQVNESEKRAHTTNIFNLPYFTNNNGGSDTGMSAESNNDNVNNACSTTSYSVPHANPSPPVVDARRPRLGLRAKFLPEELRRIEELFFWHACVRRNSVDTAEALVARVPDGNNHIQKTGVSSYKMELVGQQGGACSPNYKVDEDFAKLSTVLGAFIEPEQIAQDPNADAWRSSIRNWGSVYTVKKCDFNNNMKPEEEEANSTIIKSTTSGLQVRDLLHSDFRNIVLPDLLHMRCSSYSAKELWLYFKLASSVKKKSQTSLATKIMDVSLRRNEKSSSTLQLDFCDSNFDNIDGEFANSLRSSTHNVNISGKAIGMTNLNLDSKSSVSSSDAIIRPSNNMVNNSTPQSKTSTRTCGPPLARFGLLPSSSAKDLRTSSVAEKLLPLFVKGSDSFTQKDFTSKCLRFLPSIIDCRRRSSPNRNDTRLPSLLTIFHQHRDRILRQSLSPRVGVAEFSGLGGSAAPPKRTNFPLDPELKEAIISESANNKMSPNGNESETKKFFTAAPVSPVNLFNPQLCVQYSTDRMSFLKLPPQPKYLFREEEKERLARLKRTLVKLGQHGKDSDIDRFNNIVTTAQSRPTTTTSQFAAASRPYQVKRQSKFLRTHSMELRNYIVERRAANLVRPEEFTPGNIINSSDAMTLTDNSLNANSKRYANYLKLQNLLSSEDLESIENLDSSNNLRRSSSSCLLVRSQCGDRINDNIQDANTSNIMSGNIDVAKLTRLDAQLDMQDPIQDSSSESSEKKKQLSTNQNPTTTSYGCKTSSITNMGRCQFTSSSTEPQTFWYPRKERWFHTSTNNLAAVNSNDDIKPTTVEEEPAAAQENGKAQNVNPEANCEPPPRGQFARATSESRTNFSLFENIKEERRFGRPLREGREPQGLIDADSSANEKNPKPAPANNNNNIVASNLEATTLAASVSVELPGSVTVQAEVTAKFRFTVPYALLENCKCIEPDKRGVSPWKRHSIPTVSQAVCHHGLSGKKQVLPGLNTSCSEEDSEECPLLLIRFDKSRFLGGGKVKFNPLGGELSRMSRDWGTTSMGGTQVGAWEISDINEFKQHNHKLIILTDRLQELTFELQSRWDLGAAHTTTLMRHNLGPGVVCIERKRKSLAIPAGHSSSQKIRAVIGHQLHWTMIEPD